MSYPVMPTMPISMAKGLKKTPNFNSVGQMTASGQGNSFVSLKPYPTYDFEFDMDHITGNEASASSVVAEFQNIFILCNGKTGLFLFTDPQDNTVTNMQFGTGDGTTTAFQLCRTIGGTAVDILQNWNGTPTISINGTPTGSVSISSTGVATFVTAPAAAAVLTVTGQFYYLCRFSEDTVDSTRSFTINSGIDQWMYNGIKFSSEFVSSSTSAVIGSGTVVLSTGQLPVLQNPTSNQTISTYGVVVPFIVGNVQDATTSPTVQLTKGSTGIWYVNGSSAGGLSVRQFGDAHSRVFLGNAANPALAFGDGTNNPDVSFAYSTGTLTMTAGVMAFSNNVSVSGSAFQAGSGKIYANRLEDNHSSPNVTIIPGTVSGSVVNWNFTVPSTGAVQILQSGDTHSRISLGTNTTEPTISMGSGSATPDIVFQRGYFASTLQPYLDLVMTVTSPDEIGFHIWRQGDANPRFDIGTTTTGNNSAIYMGDGTNIVDLGLTRLVDPNGGPAGNGVLTFGYWGANSVLTALGVLSDSTVATNTAGFSSSQAGRMWYSSTTNTINYWDGTNVHALGGRLGAYDSSPLTANLGSTNLVASMPQTAMVAVDVSAIITIVASTGAATSTLPSIVITWTDGNNSTTQTATVSAGNTLDAGAGGSATTNSLTTRAQAHVNCYAKTGTAITISTTGYASNTANQMTYVVNARANLK